MTRICFSPTCGYMLWLCLNRTKNQPVNIYIQLIEVLKQNVSTYLCAITGESYIAVTNAMGSCLLLY